MSLEIQAVSVKCDDKYLDKSPFYQRNANDTIYGATYNGILVASEHRPVDMLEPIIDISDTGDVPLASLNYCYIPLWRRYYYMKPYAIGSYHYKNPVTLEEKDILKYRVHMKIDPLMSWKDSIKTIKAQFVRMEHPNDGSQHYAQDIPAYEDKAVIVSDLGALPKQSGYYLTVNGGVSS